MRLVSIGILTAALAVGGCNRAETIAKAAAGDDKSNAGTAAVEPGTPTEASAKAAAPTEREITIPAGTAIPITLDTSVGSDISSVEQAVSAHITRNVVVGGQTVLAAGSHVGGVVTDATRSGKVKGRAHVALRFNSVTAAHDNAKYRIASGSIARTAPATKKKDAMKIGAPAAGGAIIGAIAGGKKGAAIGTAVGGGAGTAVVMSTRGEEVRLPKGTALTLKLSEPLTVHVRG